MVRKTGDSNASDKRVGPNAGFPTSSAMAEVFAALSNPVRIDILRHIAIHRQCGCKEITEIMPLAQSTVSQHLKVLVEAGLIHVEAVPPRSRYKVNDNLMQEMSRVTAQFLKSCCSEMKSHASDQIASSHDDDAKAGF